MRIRILLFCCAIASTLIFADRSAVAIRMQDKTQPAPSTNGKPGPDCGCEISIPRDTLAIVNGVKITTQEVEARIKDSVGRLQQQVIDARDKELYLQINSKLLEAEAKKRGIGSTQLLAVEVLEKTVAPTDEEARAFYDKNRDRLRVSYDQAKAYIFEYLKKQQEAAMAKKLADRLRASAKIQMFAEKAPPPHTDADHSRLLAIVNDQRIISNDIEDNLKSLIFQVQERVYAIRLNEVNLRINDVLLQEEALKRGVTQEGLLQAEIAKRTKSPTEADAKAFFDQNKDGIKGEFEQVKAQIIAYLEETQKRGAEEQLADELRKTAQIEVFLTPPESPVFIISTNDQPSIGPANAPVTLIAFTDFECPRCADFHREMERLIAEFGDRLRVVVRDFPLQQHKNAIKAAIAAEAAREQGKYWEYATLLFHNQKALGVERLREYASKLSLDRERFDDALDKDKFASFVQRDLMDGLNLGINSTPTIYLNGRRIEGRTYETIKPSIADALKRAEEK